MAYLHPANLHNVTFFVKTSAFIVSHCYNQANDKRLRHYSVLLISRKAIARINISLNHQEQIAESQLAG